MAMWLSKASPLAMAPGDREVVDAHTAVASSLSPRLEDSSPHKARFATDPGSSVLLAGTRVAGRGGLPGTAWLTQLSLTRNRAAGRRVTAGQRSPRPRPRPAPPRARTSGPATAGRAQQRAGATRGDGTAAPRSMTAIGVQAQRLVGPKKPHHSFFESFIRTLIIVCAALAVVLSSVSICDGHWLLADNHLFGLWHFCTLNNHSEPHCLRDLSQAHVPGMAISLGIARSVAALAVVAAIFGLEFLMVSQMCEDIRSRRKWAIGSFLLLVAFILSSGGLLSFVVLLRNQVTLTSFTLMFWCEFTASFLFFLNAISGLHINSLTQPWYQLRRY